MTTILSLAVNDENGDVTQECCCIEIEVNGETVMRFGCELSFLEIPDNVLQIGNVTFEWKTRSTMVGNVFWNAYRIAAVDMVHLVNYLWTADDLSVDIEEAYTLLWNKWCNGTGRFTNEDFLEAIAQ